MQYALEGVYIAGTTGAAPYSFVTLTGAETVAEFGVPLAVGEKIAADYLLGSVYLNDTRPQNRLAQQYALDGVYVCSTLGANELRAVVLTGAEVTADGGDLSAAFMAGGNLTVTLTPNRARAATSAPQVNINIPFTEFYVELTGAGLAAAAGSITIPRALTVDGFELTAAAGVVSTSATALSVTLTGLEATAEAGDLDGSQAGPPPLYFPRSYGARYEGRQWCPDWLSS